MFKHFKEAKKYMFNYYKYKKDLREIYYGSSVIDKENYPTFRAYKEANDWAKEIDGDAVEIVNQHEGYVGMYKVVPDWCVEGSGN